MAEKEKKKISKVKIAVLVLFFILIGALGAGSVYISNLFNKMEQVELNKNNLGANEEADKSITNIALFGIDTVDEIGRSDAIMILTLDEKHGKLKLTSIMRDSYVEIPGRDGLDKINHAYAYGGPELAIQTLNHNFDLNITEFMAVKMSQLPKIIDKLGGIDINITQEEVDLNTINGIKSPGVYTLNGEQVMAYSRIRYATGGDAKRTERHRTVLNAMFEKLRYSSVTEYPGLISEFLPMVQTSMSATEILDLATKSVKLLSKGIEQNRFPMDEDMVDRKINGVYYLDFDKAIVKEKIQNYIYNDTK